MTAQEFVQALDRENQALLRRLEPEATLKPEVEGSLTVLNLLKVALKNEVEATEIAARWLVHHRRRRREDGLRPAGGGRGQALPLDRATACASWASTRSGFDPLAKGYGPLFQYLDSLKTTVERVAAGQFTREAIAVVKNRQFIEFCDRAGDAATAALYRDVIEPDERFHHELGRHAPAALRHRRAEAQEAGAPRGGPHALARGGAPDGGAPDRGHPPRPRLLMERGTRRSPPELAEVGRGPTADIDSGAAPRSSRHGEYPELDVRAISAPARRAAAARRASRPGSGDSLGRLHRLREYLFDEQGFTGNSRGLLRPAEQLSYRRAGPPGRHSRSRCRLVLIEVGRRLGLDDGGHWAARPLHHRRAARRVARSCSTPSTAAPS